MSRENFIAYLDSKILDVKEEEKALEAEIEKKAEAAIEKALEEIFKNLQFSI